MQATKLALLTMLAMLTMLAGNLFAQKIEMPNTLGPAGSSPFPIVRGNDVKGGPMSVADLAARDAIPAERRQVGMLAWVISENRSYLLQGGLTNADWKAVPDVFAAAEIADTTSFPCNPGNWLFVINPNEWWYCNGNGWEQFIGGSETSETVGGSDYVLTFDSTAQATGVKGIYSLSSSNNLGLPSGVIISGTEVTYRNDSLAALAGVDTNEVYFLSEVNDYALPRGLGRVLYPTKTYTSDNEALLNGVDFGDLYSVGAGNIYAISENIAKEVRYLRQREVQQKGLFSETIATDADTSNVTWKYVGFRVRSDVTGAIFEWAGTKWVLGGKSYSVATIGELTELPCNPSNWAYVVDEGSWYYCDGSEWQKSYPFKSLTTAQQPVAELGRAYYNSDDSEVKISKDGLTYENLDKNLANQLPEGPVNINANGNLLRIDTAGMVIIQNLDNTGVDYQFTLSNNTSIPTLINRYEAGDTVSIRMQGNEITFQNSSGQTTLSEIMRKPSTGQLVYTSPTTYTEGSPQTLTGASSSNLFNFTATDSSLVYSGPDTKFLITGKTFTFVDATGSDEFIASSEIYINNVEQNISESAGTTTVHGATGIGYITNPHYFIVELTSGDEITMKINCVESASASFTNLGSSLSVMELK